MSGAAWIEFSDTTRYRARPHNCVLKRGRPGIGAEMRRSWHPPGAGIPSDLTQPVQQCPSSGPSSTLPNERDPPSHLAIVLRVELEEVDPRGQTPRWRSGAEGIHPVRARANTRRLEDARNDPPACVEEA